MYPSDQTDTRQNRAKTDSELAAFYSGTMFYSFIPLAIAASGTLNIKLVRACNIILRQFRLDTSSGDHVAKIYTGATDGGGWTQGTVFPRNGMSTRPPPIYTTQAQIYTGGSFSGGTQIDQIRSKTSGATAQQQSVGQTIADAYGAPAGVGYYSITNNDTATSSGILHILWEEVP